MNKFEQVWRSLQDEEYRREYSSDVGTGLAFQIRLLRERNGWTQQHLAQLTNRQQETISQWENPNYGRYTLNSLESLAVAFDVALMVKFAPFGELVEWNTSLTPQRLAPPSFSEEDWSRQMAGGSSSGAITAVAGAEPSEAMGTTVVGLIDSKATFSPATTFAIDSKAPIWTAMTTVFADSKVAPSEETSENIGTAQFREENRAYARAA